MVERFDDRCPGHVESATQIIPDRDTQFVACLGDAQEGVAAIPSDLTEGSGADLSPSEVTADVVFRSVGVERDVWPFQHHQQFGLVGMQPGEQAVQGDEAGAVAEDAIEPRPQRETASVVREITYLLRFFPRSCFSITSGYFWASARIS